MPLPSLGALLAALGLAWLAGVAVQLQQAQLWPPGAYAAGLGIALLAALIATAASMRRVRAPVWIGATALAAFALTGLHAAWRIADRLAPQLEGRDVLLTGVIADLPRPGENGVRFRFDVEQAQIEGAAASVPQQVWLTWYAQRDAEGAAPVLARDALRAGQRWRLQARLKQPHGSVNPHGFDYELYLFEQGVRATGYVRDGVAPQLLAPAAGHWIARWRQSVRDALLAGVADPGAAGVLAALAVGDQAAIARDDWAVFRATGVAHLMSISGLHVTMFAWLAALLVAPLWRRSARAMLWFPAQRAAGWAGVAAALGYAVFSGWGVPAQRTVWMLATVMLLQSLGRRWPWPLVLLAAAVVVTLGDPWALLQPGFWLSFMAVGLLMSSEFVRGAPRSSGEGADGARALRWLRALWAHAHAGLRAQVIATLGLAPLTLVFFGQFSIVGLVANLVAIPLVTLVITPLALLGAIAAPLWSLAAWVVEGLVGYLHWLAGMPFAVWSVPAAPLWAQLGALIGALLLVLPLPWRLRLLAAALALPLLLPPRELPPDGTFALTAVDVGQGTAVLLRTANHLLVYDAGPRYSPNADAGDRVVLPLLRASGESRIDLLVLSHRDSDHVGGAASLLAALPVEMISSSLEADHPLLQLDVAHRRCEAGQRWRWDGVDFEVLHPTAAEAERARKSNALSCVLRIEGRASSVLLTGDIEREQEAALVARDGAALRSDVLLVAHHGSRSSSSDAFLDAVQPRIAIIQAGYLNRFRHPAPEVVLRLRERGIAVYDTAHCGAWLMSPAGSARCQRDADLRYWRHRTDLPVPASGSG